MKVTICDFCGKTYTCLYMIKWIFPRLGFMDEKPERKRKVDVCGSCMCEIREFIRKKESERNEH